MNDTVFALATPVGGAIAIVRISGQDTRAAYSAAFTGRCENRRMSPGLVMDGEEPVDHAMGAFFRGPHSYTGEDMAELYIHGGAAVASRTLSALARLGLRPAEPGEFTQRAFLNGKLDLARAEAVMDVIAAGTDRARSSALEQLRGGLSRRIAEVEDGITDLLSAIDAAIDYPEELEEDVASTLHGDIAGLLSQVRALISSGMAARVIREGVRAAILGRPNAGKSTLFNALLEEDRAIVTPAPGTTRDVIEGEAVINGVKVRLFDTAGIRETGDQAESIGVERALELADLADLLLIALEAGRPLGQEERRLLSLPGKKLAVICKLDAHPGKEALELAGEMGVEAVAVSAATGEGMEALKARIACLPPQGESALITNSRHIAALNRAGEALSCALEAGEELDCLATDLRAALAALGEITGADVDAKVIERIFERFCVGK